MLKQQPMRPVVRNYTHTVHTVATGDPDIDALLPTRLLRASASVEITGVNTAIASALRRAAASEIPVRAMWFETSALTTDNPFILVDMLQRRIKLIPIDQQTDLKSKFRLHARNNTAALRSVYSSEIEQIGGRGPLPFNGTFELFTLESGQSLTISEITVDIGYNYMDAAYTVALHPACVPIGADPYNEFATPEPAGECSSVANPTDFIWRFDTNGTADPVAIMTAAADSVINRMRAVLSHVDSAIENQDLYVITLPNESATVGALIMRNMLEVYPSIPFVSFVRSSHGRNIDIKVRTSDDLRVVMSGVVEYTVGIFTEIRAQLAGLSSRG